MSLKGTVKKLFDYEYNGERPITIVGPDETNAESLRVYAYGGLLGAIDTNGNFIKNKNMGKYYKHLLPKTIYKRKWGDDVRINNLQYLSNKYPTIIDYKDRFVTLERSCTENLINNEWLDFALCAMKNWGRYRNEKNNELVPHERAVQCQIAKKYMMFDNIEWCICDIEYKDTKTKGEPDFVVFDKTKRQFGFLEFKLNNKSTKNIKKHYDDNIEISEQKSVVENILKRCRMLYNAGLMDKIEDVDINEIWFGYLFVGGVENTSRKKIKNALGSIKDVSEKCYFRYVENIDQLETNGLTIDTMESFDKFTGKAK